MRFLTLNRFERIIRRVRQERVVCVFGREFRTSGLAIPFRIRRPRDARRTRISQPKRIERRFIYGRGLCKAQTEQKSTYEEKHDCCRALSENVET